MQIPTLEQPTQQIAKFYENRPTALKATLVVNHLFRAASMVGFMFIPGIPKPVAWSVCALGSLFYRLTVEKNCAYKFALPAFLGAAAVMALLPTFRNLMQGGAFATASAGALTVLSFVPLLLYAAYVPHAVHHEVEANRCKCSG
ncbi:MAG: hypothetical protein S4CHLAM81_08320 [Chlamydiales bacterium]|nr:hypothetical protein [Chlamydiales bacterium]MCH9635614.1 hypothetical protein [Chlamydiales bacterium]MCH9704072.1 hypothetical protein [Chlamydiota bacterium]